MSTEKRLADLHIRLTDEDRKRLSVLAEVAGYEADSAYAATLLAEIVRKKCHDASVIESRLAGLGIEGRGADRRGKPRE